MKKPLTLIIGAAVLSSVPASAAILIAGWDSFTAEPLESSSTATFLDADTAATMSGTGTGGNWSDWNNNFLGASGDGTFGNLSSTVASASTNVGAGTTSGDNANLSLNRSVKPGSLTFSLVNNSGSDRVFDGFFFDGAARFSQAAPDFELTFADAISGTAISGTLASGGMPGVDAARDQGIDLSGLTDNVWENGSTATFTLTFSGGDPSAGTGGGQETLIDNIGITVVPEPSTTLLGALGALCLLRRRR